MENFQRIKRFDVVLHLAGEVGRLNGEEYPQYMICLKRNRYVKSSTIVFGVQFKTWYFGTSEIYGKLSMKKKLVRKIFAIGPDMVTNVYAMVNSSVKV